MVDPLDGGCKCSCGLMIAGGVGGLGLDGNLKIMVS